MAGLDHIVGRGGVVGFGVPDHVHNVRAQRHLHIDAGGQVRARGVRLERIAQQAGARLAPDAEVRGRPSGSIRSSMASILARSIASDRPGGLLNMNWAM